MLNSLNLKAPVSLLHVRWKLICPRGTLTLRDVCQKSFQQWANIRHCHSIMSSAEGERLVEHIQPPLAPAFGQCWMLPNLDELSAECCCCGTCATENLSNVVAHFEREGGFVALRSGMEVKNVCLLILKCLVLASNIHVPSFVFPFISFSASFDGAANLMHNEQPRPLSVLHSHVDVSPIGCVACTLSVGPASLFLCTDVHASLPYCWVKLKKKPHFS